MLWKNLGAGSEGGKKKWKDGKGGLGHMTDATAVLWIGYREECG